MDIKKINEAFDNFRNLNIIIIGDVMVDSYLWGKVERISPEAPVPVVTLNKRENRFGGAANVAMNIKSLGANPIMCSVIGDDAKAHDFQELMDNNKLSSEGIIKSKNRVTTTKFRIIGNNYQMLRVDDETTKDLQQDETEQLFSRISSIIENKNIAAIIFQDYDKGVITTELIEKVITKAQEKKIPVIVDPKKKNFNNYKRVTLFKPNLKELREGLEKDISYNDFNKFTDSCIKFMKENEFEVFMVTLSESGVFVCYSEADGNTKSKLIPAHIRNISDVSGAGDTVISTAAVCLASGLSAFETAAISNLAGGLVCEEVGVVPVNKNKLLEEIKKL
jgi:rfaE bifunctional protein kinase chain/domain